MIQTSSRLRWLLAALVAALIIAALEQWAVADFLYWRYVWFDVPMHFLGGLTIALSLVALSGSRFRPYAFITCMVLVAVGWEVFEVIIGSPQKANYVLDTSLDLLMDTLGASLIYLIARYSVWRSA